MSHFYACRLANQLTHAFTGMLLYLQEMRAYVHFSYGLLAIRASAWSREFSPSLSWVATCASRHPGCLPLRPVDINLALSHHTMAPAFWLSGAAPGQALQVVDGLEGAPR